MPPVSRIMGSTSSQARVNLNAIVYVSFLYHHDLVPLVWAALWPIPRVSSRPPLCSGGCSRLVSSAWLGCSPAYILHRGPLRRRPDTVFVPGCPEKQVARERDPAHHASLPRGTDTAHLYASACPAWLIGANGTINVPRMWTSRLCESNKSSLK